MAGAGVGTKHSGVVTTCGVTSIKENPGDARIPISAAKLADEEMDDHLESSGATTFFTLVRYNMPELLDDYMREKYEKTEASKMLKRGGISKDEKISKKKKILSSINSSLSFSSNSEASDGKEEETPEEIIFMLFGPRVWEHKGNVWMRSISTEPASREDVRYLTTRLNNALGEFLTTSHGICQTRRELYGQLLEELIRQEMMACKEKGLLLLRVRTELKQTMMAYQELFDTSIKWGRQTMVESEQGWENLLKRKGKLEKEVFVLEREKRNCSTELDMMTKHQENMQEEQMRNQMEEMQSYNRINTQLKMQLEFMPPEFLPPEFLTSTQD